MPGPSVVSGTGTPARKYSRKPDLHALDGRLLDHDDVADPPGDGEIARPV